MHTVCDVRNLNLYSGLKPADIWRSYKRALNEALDAGDRQRPLNPDFGRQHDYASA